MFRSSARFAFIISILALAVITVYLVIQAAGLGGLPGYILGFAIFALILTAMLTVLSKMNDRGANTMMHDHQTRR
jgi:hypothetical protein